MLFNSKLLMVNSGASTTFVSNATPLGLCNTSDLISFKFLGKFCLLIQALSKIMAVFEPVSIKNRQNTFSSLFQNSLLQ